MKKVNTLLKMKIAWQPVKFTKTEWFAIIDGEKYSLRMNDFPDEPLYTIFNQEDIINIDDAPMGWIIPFSD